MLKRIQVDNFRTFVGFDWAPPPVCVLAGDNGSGKTALFEVLCLLQDIVVGGKMVSETPSRSARTAWLDEAEQRFEIDVDVKEECYRYSLTIAPDDRGADAVREELRAGDDLLYSASEGTVLLFGDKPTGHARAQVGFDRRRSFLSAMEPRADNRRTIAFRDAIASVWAMQPDPRRIEGRSTAESTWLERDLSNFASWYRGKALEDDEPADALRGDLRKALPGFSALLLKEIADETKDLRARFTFGGKTHQIPWAKLSDGQRLLIALYGMLRLGLSKATLIALDECENYVSPSEIQPWFRALGDAAAERHQQLVVISHHPESIDYLAASSAWEMWRDKEGGHARIAPLEPDLGAGETAYDLVRHGSPDDRRGDPQNGGEGPPNGGSARAPCGME
jgi:predicted ATPase